ncbi:MULTISPECIES: glutathione S-transferase family protein [unclassified Ruegeria]|uniref:glutathione S-transferase family protein n=1 Tax=unclassified Ruegeria TaxID=2625375 RepID=UPI001492BFEB|nr:MULTISPECIES: glutathione S-transferase family protein [unclassified Ruegeria]NOD76356.1 glutathione S-transferase [Ruegeria sp. HKCCD4332]NOD90311.1 glutathione S-transferase [Ruegeria sp. HKCCD4318]NOE15384.1 glutathione S-transferase [Ruegeria sp. HKCCD4318-2]NOG10406.1 glutathione S-transferase family protein [Ruegeria sp. HKCCD4315]
MQLYFAPRTISVAVVIALEEAGLEYEAIQLDFAGGEQTKPAYRQINPKGRVPALVVDGGILTETGALLEFIAAQAPSADLVPADPVMAARMREVMFYLASTMHVNHAHKVRGARWADKKPSWKDMKDKVPQTMTASCEYICSNGLRGPFVLGEAFSLADAYLYVVCSWLEGDGVDVSAFPKILAFREAMEARPSVQAVRAAGML